MARPSSTLNRGRPTSASQAGSASFAQPSRAPPGPVRRPSTDDVPPSKRARPAEVAGDEGARANDAVDGGKKVNSGANQQAAEQQQGAAKEEVEERGQESFIAASQTGNTRSGPHEDFTETCDEEAVTEPDDLTRERMKTVVLPFVEQKLAELSEEDQETYFAVYDRFQVVRAQRDPELWKAKKDDDGRIYSEKSSPWLSRQSTPVMTEFTELKVSSKIIRIQWQGVGWLFKVLTGENLRKAYFRLQDFDTETMNDWCISFREAKTSCNMNTWKAEGLYVASPDKKDAYVGETECASERCRSHPKSPVSTLMASRMQDDPWENWCRRMAWVPPPALRGRLPASLLFCLEGQLISAMKATEGTNLNCNKIDSVCWASKINKSEAEEIWALVIKLLHEHRTVLDETFLSTYLPPIAAKYCISDKSIRLVLYGRQWAWVSRTLDIKSTFYPSGEVPVSLRTTTEQATYRQTLAALREIPGRERTRERFREGAAAHRARVAAGQNRILGKRNYSEGGFQLGGGSEGGGSEADSDGGAHMGSDDGGGEGEVDKLDEMGEEAKGLIG